MGYISNSTHSGFPAEGQHFPTSGNGIFETTNHRRVGESCEMAFLISVADDFGLDLGIIEI